MKDLDDVRSHMIALNEIRESEIRIDIMILPIDSAYTTLNKYNLIFNDGNAERVDSLPYGWKLLKQQVSVSGDIVLSLEFLVILCCHWSLSLFLICIHNNFNLGETSSR